MKKIIPLSVFIALTLVFQLKAGTIVPGDSLLAEYIREAVAVSPALKSLASRQVMFARRIPQISSLPDPRLVLNINNLPLNSFSFTQEPMTGKTLGLSQSFPFPGKLSTRNDIASSDEHIAGRELSDARNDLLRSVSKVYYDLVFLRKSIAIENESRDVMRNISKVVQAKYEVAKGTQQDVIKSDFEISRITDRILRLEEQEKVKAEELNSLLLRDAGTELRTDSLPNVEILQFTVNELLDTARQQRPFLQGLRDAIEKADAQKKLADLEWYPDFMVGAAYTQRDHIASSGANLADLVSLSVGFNLPLDNGGKRSAAVEEAEAMADMYRNSYDAALQQLQTSFSTALAALTYDIERLDLLTTGLMPQANQALGSALSGYQVGAIDYLSVLDATLKLFQLHTDFYRLRADYWKTRADIDFQAGNTVPR